MSSPVLSFPEAALLGSALMTGRGETRRNELATNGSLAAVPEPSASASALAALGTLALLCRRPTRA